MQYALDYSAGHPAAATVIADGYPGIIRYVGFDPALRPKCIGAAEYADMNRAGVGVALVYEDQAGDALAGRAAGRTAATRARQWADRIGFPAGRPLYLACDTDVVTEAQFVAVLDYLRGAGDVLGPGLVGVYGEYDVVERAAQAGVAHWFWQTMAWSGGRVSPRNHLRQLVGTTYVGGVACDRNEIRQADWGQHNATTTREDDMAQADVDAIIAYLKTPEFRLTVRGEVITALSDPTHAYLQDELQPLKDALGQIRTGVAAQADDEAKILGFLAGLHLDLTDEQVAQIADHVGVDYDRIAQAVRFQVTWPVPQ